MMTHETSRRAGRVPTGRLVLLVAVAVAVLAGLDAALLRLGAVAPVRSEPLAAVHGVLMVYGFLGTAIMLERAVALRSGGSRRDGWGYAAPAASGAGTVLLLAQVVGAPIPGGRLLPGAAWVTATALFVGIYAAIWRRQPSFAVLIQALGALAGLGGAALWARGLEAASIVPWWAALLVLTIIGERLELARLAFVSGRTEARVLTEATAVLVALIASLVTPAAGYPLLGLALGVLVLDVAVRDVARRTIRIPGLPRLMAACMLAGYGWALVSALVWVIGGPAVTGSERRPGPPRRPRTDKLTTAWILAALVTSAVMLTTRSTLPEPLWTSVHVVTLGVLTSSVLQWSWYFTRALLHLPAWDRRSGRDATIRMLAFHTALVGLVVAMWTGQVVGTIAGAGAIGAIIAWHGLAIVRAARGRLGGRYAAVIRYYVAAAAFLVVGCILAGFLTVAMFSAGAADWLLDARDELTLAHALVNVGGWIGPR